MGVRRLGTTRLCSTRFSQKQLSIPLLMQILKAQRLEFLAASMLAGFQIKASQPTRSSSVNGSSGRRWTRIQSHELRHGVSDGCRWRGSLRSVAVCRQRSVIQAQDVTVCGLPLRKREHCSSVIRSQEHKMGCWWALKGHDLASSTTAVQLHATHSCCFPAFDQNTCLQSHVSTDNFRCQNEFLSGTGNNNTSPKQTCTPLVLEGVTGVGRAPRASLPPASSGVSSPWTHAGLAWASSGSSPCVPPLLGSPSRSNSRRLVPNFQRRYPRGKTIRVQVVRMVIPAARVPASPLAGQSGAAAAIYSFPRAALR